MDWALTQLLEGYQVTEAGGYEVPLPQPAGLFDWLAEFRDASQGARPAMKLTGEAAHVCAAPGTFMLHASAGLLSKLHEKVHLHFRLQDSSELLLLNNCSWLEDLGAMNFVM